MLAQGLANGANTLVGQGLNMLNYGRQRRDSLADYNMQLEYNKPINQVKRLTEAGISPYAQSGQSLLASAPTPRPASMGQSNTSKPLDVLAMKQGVEQVKLLQLEQQKKIAETKAVEADALNKRLEYDTNVDDWSNPKQMGILAKSKHFNIDKILSMINKDNQGSALIGEQTENARASRAGIIANSEIAKIEQLFRSQLLQGRSDLLQGQIGMYKNKNYRDEIQNYFAKRDFANQSNLISSNAQIRQQEAELANILPASMRYFLEKMGGNRAIGSGIGVLLRRLLFR